MPLPMPGNPGPVSGPPPSPAMSGQQGAAMTGQPTPGGLLYGGGPAAAMQGVISALEQVDQTLLTVAASAPALAGPLNQARAIILQATAQFLQQAATQPTGVGTQFPGGGIGSGLI